MTAIGTHPTLTAEQADDLLEATMRAGRIPFAPVDGICHRSRQQVYVCLGRGRP